MRWLNLRGNWLLAAITVSAGMGFILFGSYTATVLSY